MQFFRLVLWAQTLYYILTALWGIIDINSFMAVTGPKTDVWLVKTVSVLLLAISFSFLSSLLIKTNEWPTIILATGCCITLAFIDFYYSANGTISTVYALDGIAELVLLAGWLFVIIKKTKSHSDLPNRMTS